MNQRRLATLALAGMTGAALGGCGKSDDPTDSEKGMGFEDKMPQINHVAENNLLGKLDDKHQALYNSLDAEGKAMALKLTAQSCAGTNECAGMNSCASADNECAGQGSCAGHSKCQMSPEMAVKIAAKRMQERRERLGY